MTRKTTQVLSVGLLLSSFVIMGLEIGSQAQSSETLNETISELETKIDELEEENSRIAGEHDRLSEGYANAFELDDVEATDADSEDEDSATSAEASSEEEDEETAESDSNESESFTVTIKEGEPSSVVADQLEYLGLIEDRYAFSDYLETNDLANKVRPGNYVVTSDMTEAELAQAIIK